MSYSTRENLQDAESAVAFAKQLTDLYPDARIVDGRWFSGTVPVADCDTVILEPRIPRGGPAVIEVFCGKRLSSGGIIWSSEQFQAFRMLPTYMAPVVSLGVNADLRQAMLAWAAGRSTR